MKPWIALSLSGSLWVFMSAAPARAVTIDLVPGTAMVALGTTVNVDVVISSLGDFMAPSLGTFDLVVSFDPAIVSPSGVAFGNFLGDATQGEALTGIDNLLPGLLNIFELSLLFDFELDALQPASFVLATISFDTVNLGTSPLFFSQVLLGDALGDPLNATTSEGAITVAAAVPEPSMVFLLLFAAVPVLLRARL